jgi:predicted dehydrogenase
MRVGVVGAGKISAQYSQSFRRLQQVQVTAVADLDLGRAQLLAAEHPGARAMDVDDLVSSADVDLVLNLTTPAAHARVALAALAAGKHVYGEKPLAATTAEGRQLLDAVGGAAAEQSGPRLACAPDTVLGTGVQTARAAVDAGAIGVPHAATAFMLTPGHERWHPDPAFYYQPGGGPLFDMGPYYLTSLVHLLGPVRRVVGAASRPHATRTVGQGPLAGTTFDVQVDTHVTGILEHHSGALTTLVMSFDTWAGRLPRIEVYGDGGSLSVPDPNYFDGPVELFPAGGDWEQLAPSAGYSGAGRGYGVADLALSLDAGRPHRAGAEVALHVLDVMESVHAAAGSGERVVLTTTCERPEPVPSLVDLSRPR